MVDMYSAVDNTQHLADGVHLNQQGTDIMANVFQEEILRVILGGDANVRDIAELHRAVLGLVSNQSCGMFTSLYCCCCCVRLHTRRSSPMQLLSTIPRSFRNCPAEAFCFLTMESRQDGRIIPGMERMHLTTWMPRQVVCSGRTRVDVIWLYIQTGRERKKIGGGGLLCDS